MSRDREGESPGLVRVLVADLEPCFLAIRMMEVKGRVQKHKIRYVSNFGF